MNDYAKGRKHLIVMIDFWLGWVESWIHKLKTFIMESALENKKHIEDFCVLLGNLKEPPSHKMLTVWLPKGGLWSETRDESATA